MNKIERVLSAVSHTEPDKVPKGELYIAPSLTRQILKNTSGDQLMDDLAIRELLNMDIYAGPVFIRPPTESMGTDDSGRQLFRDWWGGVWQHSGVEGTPPQLIYPALIDITEVRSLKFPSPDDFPMTEVVTVCSTTDFFFLAEVRGFFEYPSRLMGFEEFLVAIKQHPELVHYLLERFLEYNAGFACRCIDAGAHACFINDDYAYSAGPLMAPADFRKLIFPFVRELVRRIKLHRDLPVFLHSDGNLLSILDDIVRLGIDGIHSIEPKAGMDLKSIKDRYGQRLCLMGNIDASYILPFGNTGEVREAVSQAITVAAPGGGYILSSCNSLTVDVPPYNALAMYQAAEELGNYPIRQGSEKEGSKQF